MRDRRGVTAITFGLTATVVIGMVGMGTEAGSWYLTRRNAQNAADPGAYAGAVRLAFAQAALPAPYNAYTAAKAQAVDAATDTATRNGFLATEIQVNTPPQSGPNAGNITAVEVIVQRSPPRLISTLFLGGGTTAIRARGVAALTSKGPACLLGNPPAGGNVTGQLIFSGSTNVQAPNCILASNSSRSDAISFGGNAATVTAEGLVSAGGCSNCDGSRVTTTEGVTPGVVTDNPFTSRDSDLLALLNAVPASPSGSCPVIPGVKNNGNFENGVTNVTIPSGSKVCALNVGNGQTATFPPGTYIINGNSAITVSQGGTLNFGAGTYYFYGTNPGASQSALSITGGTVNFGAGTYYFYDTSLNINGGTVNGTGVSFLFTGPSNQVGGPNIGAGAIVHLSAPLDGQGHPSPQLDGMLFYRDSRATNGSSQGNPIVNINGGPSVTLAGGMYFPSSYVKYSGSLDSSICSVLIGGTIEMTGNSGLNVQNCSQYGNITPTVKIVRLVE